MITQHYGEALSQLVARIFPLPRLDRRQPGMTMDFVPFRSRVGAMRRPVGQRRPRFATVTLSSPHRYRPLLLLLSVLAAPKKQFATAGDVAGLGLSFFAVQLAGQLAPLLYTPQHFGALQAGILCSTFSTVWQIFQKSSPLAPASVLTDWALLTASVLTDWAIALTRHCLFVHGFLVTMGKSIIHLSYCNDYFLKDL